MTFPKYMMATVAIHQLGDISRDEPDLCIICEEEEDSYYGNWLEGFGFVGVKFPKTSTRLLTPEEKERYSNKMLYLGKTPMRRILFTEENS